jgi:hypothetical protein
MKTLQLLGRRLLDGLRWFFEGWAFATFTLWTLLFFNALMLALLFVPASESALGSFAQDFKRRCLEYDPVTGRFDWSYVIPYLTAPLVLGVATVLVYRRQLSAVLRRPLSLSVCAAAALVVVLGLTAGMYAVSPASNGRAAAPGQPGFMPPLPAAKLRTELPAPRFELLNHEGDLVSPQKMLGKVVILTAVYSTCPDT